MAWLQLLAAFLALQPTSSSREAPPASGTYGWIEELAGTCFEYSRRNVYHRACYRIVHGRFTISGEFQASRLGNLAECGLQEVADGGRRLVFNCDNSAYVDGVLTLRYENDRLVVEQPQRGTPNYLGPLRRLRLLPGNYGWLGHVAGSCYRWELPDRSQSRSECFTIDNRVMTQTTVVVDRDGESRRRCRFEPLAGELPLFRLRCRGAGSSLQTAGFVLDRLVVAEGGGVSTIEQLAEQGRPILEREGRDRLRLLCGDDVSRPTECTPAVVLQQQP